MDLKENARSIIAVFVVLLCILGCNWYNTYRKEKQKEEKMFAHRADSIRKAFIKDSLEHDPSYQDSIRKENNKYLRMKAIRDSVENEQIIGFVYGTDSVFHSLFHPIKQVGYITESNFSIYDAPYIVFVNKRIISKMGYKSCSICEEKEGILTKFEIGDLINTDDIEDYVINNIEDFEYLFEKHGPEPDFDNDRW